MLETASNGAGGAPVDDLDLELAAVADAKPEKVTVPDELPEKYSGKSVKDIAEMHMNAEKDRSRLANELGELRRVTDQILNANRAVENTRKPNPEPKPVTVEALLDNPNNVLTNAIEASPVAQKADQAVNKVTELERMLAQERFSRSHPTYQTDIQDPQFIEWVKKSPARLKLAQAADRFDFNAATDLWSLWDEHKELTSAKTMERANDVAAKASTVKASPATGGSKDPVYSRAKLMELRMKAEGGDPIAQAKWHDQAFQERIVKAYADNRVR